MSDSDQERSAGASPDEPERPLQIPPELPVLPLRDTVLFPNSFMPLAVAREASVRLVEEANATGRRLGNLTLGRSAVVIGEAQSGFFGEVPEARDDPGDIRASGVRPGGIGLMYRINVGHQVGE